MSDQGFSSCYGSAGSSTKPDFHPYLFTNASLVGWGAHLGDLSVSGQWSVQWSKEHINVLELQAVWLALKSFHQVISGCHVLLSPDNTTVAAYLNKGGGPGLEPCCSWQPSC